MKIFLIIICLSLAAALWMKPLPKLDSVFHISIPNIAIRKRIKTRMTFEEELQFVFNLKSQLSCGINQFDALGFAIERAPEFALMNSKQALASQARLLPALRKDAINNKHPALETCANLLEINTHAGSSINKALTQIVQTLINRRKHEQLIATELASTKATVFVLASLPIMGAGMGLILGTDSIAWIFGSTGGRLCFVLGVALELIGWLWINRLLKRALADIE